jgi:hypothetical protein
MATVFTIRKKYTADDELLRDFFYDTIIADDPIDILQYFANLNAKSRKMLSDYIVYRLAEVDPGYVVEATDGNG